MRYKASLTREQFMYYEMRTTARLLREGMVTVVGEKYRTKDSSFGYIDANVFLMRIQEQDDSAAKRSPSTVTKLSLMKLLYLLRYIEDVKANVDNKLY